MIGVKNNDLWIMLICTVRYAMGRASYITSLTADLYQKYKEALTVQQRLQIAREIQIAVGLAVKDGRLLGDSIDHANWQRLAEDILRTEKQGGANV